jgi:transcription elongation factor Elf1
MRINKIISQSRRDFTAEYVCDNCGATHVGSGYDDTFFHQTVIPKMVCKTCGKTAGSNYRALAPKYDDRMVV